MKSKKQPVKLARKFADVRKVRFGAGMAPAVIRTRDTQTQDGGKVRFGAGMAPAGLRK